MNDEENRLIKVFIFRWLYWYESVRNI